MAGDLVASDARPGRQAEAGRAMQAGTGRQAEAGLSLPRTNFFKDYVFFNRILFKKNPAVPGMSGKVMEVL